MVLGNRNTQWLAVALLHRQEQMDETNWRPRGTATIRVSGHPGSYRHTHLVRHLAKACL